MSSYKTKSHEYDDKMRERMRLLVKRKTFPGLDLYQICREYNIDSYIMEDWCRQDPILEKDMRPKINPIMRGAFKYDEELHPQIILDYMASGKTRHGLAGALEISYTSLMKLLYCYKSARAAYDTGLAIGASLYDRIGNEQLMSPEENFDFNLFKNLRNNSHSERVRKGIIGKDAKESLHNLLNRFVEDNSKLGKDEATVIHNIIKSVGEVDEMAKLKDQVQELLDRDNKNG